MKRTAPLRHAFRTYTKREESGQTVYILGAGASASESPRVPTNSNLLQLIINTKHDVVQHKAKDNIRSFLKDLHYGTKHFPTFEEVFTVVDLSISEERYFKGWPRQRILELRKDLLSAVGAIITATLPTNPKVHSSFVKRLFNIAGVNNKNTSFIDFNYDITLDRVLTAYQDLVGDLEYGCYFRSFDVTYKNPRANWDPADFERALFLLKLHGSFNWLWCPTCNFLRIHPDENVGLHVINSEKRCGRCHGPLDSLIIPPAWFKTYRNSNIVSMWTEAEFLLTQAEQIVFVGYSLSEADINLRLLLKRALAFQKPKVTVVSNHEAANDDDTYLRYRRFFGRVDWFPDGFKEFAKQPTHAIIST